MPRRDRDDDDEDLDDRRHRRPAKQKPKFPLWLILTLAIGGPVFVIGGFFCLFAVLWVGKADPPPKKDDLVAGVGGKVAEKKQYTRDEFRKATIGKTPDQLIADVGRPDSTYDKPNGDPREWWYLRRVLNPVTGKYETAILEFTDNKVREVKW